MCNLTLQGPRAKLLKEPPTYHVIVSILMTSYVAKGVFGPLKHQGLGVTDTYARPIAMQLLGTSIKTQFDQEKDAPELYIILSQCCLLILKL